MVQRRQPREDPQAVSEAGTQGFWSCLGASAIWCFACQTPAAYGTPGEECRPLKNGLISALQVDEINALASKVSKLTDTQLRTRIADCRTRYQDGASLESLLAEVFAVSHSFTAAIRVLLRLQLATQWHVRRLYERRQTGSWASDPLMCN